MEFKKEAERLATDRGMWVSNVTALGESPAPPPVVEYQPLPTGGLPIKPLPANLTGPTFICPNHNCGYQGPANKSKRGSTGLGFLLLLLALIPGILYLAICCGDRFTCPKCGCEVKL